jgi:hypothetical protein
MQILYICFFKTITQLRSKLPENLEEKEELLEIPVKERNRESIPQRVGI